MTQQAHQKRRAIWASAATNGQYEVVPGQQFPKTTRRKGNNVRHTYSFVGVGIDLMLKDTGQDWMRTRDGNDGTLAYVIEETTERLCAYYSLNHGDFDELFGDRDDIQTRPPEDLARALVAFEPVNQDEPPDAPMPKPRPSDLAAFAYYNHNDRLIAIAVRHPTNSSHYRLTMLAMANTQTIFSKGDPHQSVFVKCDPCNEEDPTPLTTKPIFYSNPLNLHLAEAITNRLRADEQADPGNITAMLADELEKAIVGDLNGQPTTPFQPPARLRQ